MVGAVVASRQNLTKIIWQSHVDFITCYKKKGATCRTLDVKQVNEGSDFFIVLLVFFWCSFLRLTVFFGSSEQNSEF
jgi:hypothetical protein